MSVAFIYQQAPVQDTAPARCYSCDGVYEGRVLRWYHDPTTDYGYVGMCPFCERHSDVLRPPVMYYTPVELERIAR